MEIVLFAASFGLSLTCFCCTYIITEAFLCMFFPSTAWKKSASQQLFVNFIGLLFGVLSCILNVIVRVATSLLRWWLFFFIVFTGFSCIYVTYNEYPSLWVGFIQFYNVNFGPYLQQRVIIPFQIVELFLKGIIPVWDSFWWFSKAFVMQGLFPIFIKEIEIVMQMSITSFHFVQNLAQALFTFGNSFFCTGTACLYPETRVLDLLTCMGDVRLFITKSLYIIKAICGTLSAPFDIITFPLLDPNFASFVHNTVNGVLHLVMVLPQVTVERCQLQSGDIFQVLLCTPDFSPVFNFFIAGINSLGLTLDNWMNIAFTIIKQLVTGEVTSCASVDMGMIPDIVKSSPVFDGNHTVIVGLTSWLYAVTDGYTAMYMGSSDTDTKIQTWPYKMDISIGVAAVTYSNTHDLDVSALSEGKTVGSMQTTSMMACNCSDTSNGMEVLCAILPMTGLYYYYYIFCTCIFCIGIFIY